MAGARRSLGGMRVVALLFLSLLFVFAQWIQAAEVPAGRAYDRGWQLRNLAPEAGILGQRVFDLCFEPGGRAWAACADGLYSYDGYEWRRYGPAEGLPSPFVRSVCVSSKGELWVGSDAGAGVYDPERRTYDSRGSVTGLANRSVRMIREDGEGTLWFSCDQWPDSNVPPGGLSSYKAGLWSTRRQEEGLPMDYVIASFREKSGRRYAMTPQGWVMEEAGGNWGAPSSEVLGLEPCLHHMAEGRGGELFGQGEKTVVVRSGGIWRSVGYQTVSLGSTRDGRVFGLQRDALRGLVWFAEWNGREFVKASAPVQSSMSARYYKVVEAPDGAVWAVGTGLVLRWGRDSGAWSHYPKLGLPRDCDRFGRVWFSGGGAVQYAEGGVIRRVEALSSYLGSDQDGVAYGFSAEDGSYVSVDLGRGGQVAKAAPGLVEVGQVLLRDAGPTWHAGRDREGRAAFASRRGEQWLQVAIEGSVGRKVFHQSAAQDGGLWVVLLADKDAEYDLYHVLEGGVTRVNLGGEKPPVTYPSFYEVGGRHWIQGYGNIYSREAKAGGPWQRPESVKAYGFHSIAMTETEMVLLSNGGRDARAGCLIYSEGRWQSQPGYYEVVRFGSDRKTLYLAGRGQLYVRRPGEGGVSFEQIPMPEDVLVQGMVEAMDGVLWLGTADGVLRHEPCKCLPKPLLELPVAVVANGAGLQMQVGAMKPFEGGKGSEAFRYSWRFDGRPWGPFVAAPKGALELGGLKPGMHRLELRCRDAHGNVSATVATAEFEVEPVPLQRRAWFVPVVLLLAGCFGFVAWQAVRRGVMISRRNEALRLEIRERRHVEEELRQTQLGLEMRVLERTQELLKTNEALKREIGEREEAEAARKRLEEQLQQAQKMQAIGTLAGGIAHDFNNILAVIIPCAHLSLKTATHDPELRENLQNILTAGERAKNLVRQILTFSRRGAGERAVGSLEPVVKETVKLLSLGLPKGVELKCVFGERIPDALIDPTQIHQVVMNLCSNAVHALEGRGGTVELRLEAYEVGAAECAVSPELKPGPHVRLVVADNGVGIPLENLSRIFDPFFTTRKTGEGTGLGLSVVHGVVKSHDGAIVVQSEAERGSAFSIYLPARRASVSMLEPNVDSAPMGRGQHVLVVDDEPVVGRLLCRHLERAAYRVSVHTSPDQALEAFSRTPNAYDLLITDRTMPGLTGPELAKRVTAMRPDLPVILVTGYGGGIDKAEALRSGILKVLSKPVDPGDFLKEVARVLDL